jgi:hypothetical protein
VCVRQEGNAVKFFSLTCPPPVGTTFLIRKPRIELHRAGSSIVYFCQTGIGKYYRARVSEKKLTKTYLRIVNAIVFFRRRECLTSARIVCLTSDGSDSQWSITCRKSGGISDFPTVSPINDCADCCFVLQFTVFSACGSSPTQPIGGGSLPPAFLR